MKNELMLLLGCGMCLSAFSAAFTPEEARRVFGETSSSVSSSGTVVGDYLFFEVKWKEDNSLPTEDREAQEMNALLEAMQRFITPQSCACTNSPFCKTLTDWLLPAAEFNVPNVKSSVVKDDSKEGNRTQVVAVEAAPMMSARDLALKSVASVNNRSEAQWAESLKKALTQFKKPDDKQKFYTLLGCPIVNLIFSRSNEYRVSVLAGCERACDELGLLAKFATEGDSFFVEYPNILWGHYAHDRSVLFFPAWEENDEGRLIEAEKLYQKGKDIPKIIKLLVESLSINPISSTKWEYLGGVLKASGKPSDALIAYVQALKISPRSQWAWKGVADCCEKAGLTENAKGLKWYLKIKE